MSGVDGGPVQLHLVDSNGMGRMTLSRVVMRRTGNNEYNEQQEPRLQQKTSHPRWFESLFPSTLRVPVSLGDYRDIRRTDMKHVWVIGVDWSTLSLSSPLA